MKITPLNNIAFGYNKEINAKLEKRLLEQQTPVNQMILKLVKTCNSTENAIIQLEGQGVKKNATSINILSDMLIPAKLFLYNLVERLFPDLSYRNIEYKTYAKEEARIPVPAEYGFNPNGMKTEYFWRTMICDGINAQIKRDSEEFNTYSPEDLYGDSDDEYDDTDYDEEDINFNGQVQGKIGQKKDKNLSQITNGKEIEIDKFTPGKNSPKSLDDVIGLDKSIEDIRNFILFPIKYPEKAKQREKDYGIEIPHFIVFHGPPGCGKTMLAEAIAVESDCPMYKIDLSQVGSTYVNGTVQLLSWAFDEVNKISKESDKPVIVFMDEMDSLLSKREDSLSKSPEDNKVVNTLLPIIASAADNNMVIIGATNMYNAIDPAAKRRIEINAYIGLPNEKDIEKLFIKELSKIKMGQNLAANEDDIKLLAKKMIGYTPSNIVSMVKEASRQAFIKNKEIEKDDILNALEEGTYEKIKEEEYMPENKRPTKKVGFGTN